MQQPPVRPHPGTSKAGEAPGQRALPFDTATGTWLKVPAADPVPGPDPASSRKGPLAKAMRVLLAIDLLAIGALFVSNIYGGAVLLFDPDSAQAEQLREQMQGGSAWDTYLNIGLSFLLFGVIPSAWLLGTRQRPWHGARTYLQLHGQRRDWLRGLALVPALLAAVFILSTLYLLATEGVEALQDGGERPVNALVQHLTWPLAVFIALAAGIGEEIFFRGILRRWIGIWAQGIVFGLAHAAGAYPPQMLFAFGLGVLFGYLLRRGWSLVTMMVAHAGYNFTLLAFALAFPEAA